MEEYDVEMLAEQPWEETLDFLTRDMDPSSIDIAVLAERYREYLAELQDYDLSIPAKAIRVCASLLKMKAMALNYDEEEEEEPENPMDFEGPVDEIMEEDEKAGLEQGPELEMPVKPRPRRRMDKSELKQALREAMEVKERREERQDRRQEMDQEFEFEEETINEKINSLYSNLKSLVSKKSSGGKVHFNRLLDQDTNEERIEKFMHVLHLENDKKVRLLQEEFLGDLHVKPEEEVAN